MTDWTAATAAKIAEAVRGGSVSAITVVEACLARIHAHDSAIGAFTVSFIQTGVVGVGLSGFYVQFFYGLIIILSLLGHRWNQIRYR